jgi:hypothetical protein
MSKGPIKLTIYNQDNEPVKELQTSIVPWGIMKRAIKLVKSLKGSEGMSQAEMLDALDDESIDLMTALVADVFSGRVTVEELNRGVELGEMLPVIMQIINKAFSGIGGDPTQPGK